MRNCRERSMATSFKVQYLKGKKRAANVQFREEERTLHGERTQSPMPPKTCSVFLHDYRYRKVTHRREGLQGKYGSFLNEGRDWHRLVHEQGAG